MNDTQQAALLAMLKTDLGIITDRYDERLIQYLAAAVTYIKEEGADLDLDTVGDMQIATMYAAWMWRRRETGDGMPRGLRTTLNKRIFSRKMRSDG